MPDYTFFFNVRIEHAFKREVLRGKRIHTYIHTMYLVNIIENTGRIYHYAMYYDNRFIKLCHLPRYETTSKRCSLT